MTDTQFVSFAHAPWPSCTVVLISYSDSAPEFPSTHGTGFFVQREQRVFLVTAGHCLVPDASNADVFLPKAKEVAARLMIPIEPPTGTRPLNTEDYIQFSSIGYAVIDNSSGEFFGTWEDGSLDIAVLEVSPVQSDVLSQVRARSVKLPPTGEWFSKSMENALKMQFNAPLIASGFPKQGTESSIDYEDMRIVTQGIHFAGHYCGTGPYPHTHTMKMVQGDIQYELNGISGGPVYMKTRNGDNPPHALVGMALRGGHGSDLLHFCSIDWLTKAIDLA
ncbi:MAG: hypothetical protein EPN76_09540 [Burkholderiaceae bacterium]|nr:MAG: hypothetical protein EPN76_09540 [Burkholderiaceae bacterium]